MRRTIAFVIALVTLGTASAVGSAWLAAGVTHFWWDDAVLLTWGEPSTNGFRARWFVEGQRSFDRGGWVATFVDAESIRPAAPQAPALPRWSRVWSLDGDNAPDDRWIEFEFGWPFPWLIARRADNSLAPSINSEDTVIDGVPIRPIEIDLGTQTVGTIGEDDQGDAAKWFEALPLLPAGVRWGPGVASIVTWSLLWFALFALARVPMALRSVGRRRGARCVHCGHRFGVDRAAVVATPELRCGECGALASSRRPFMPGTSIVCIAALALLVLLADGVWAAFLMHRHVRTPPIHAAALRGDLDGIDGALVSGAKVDERLSRTSHDVAHGTTPLMWAASTGQVDAITRLLDAGADAGAFSDNRWQSVFSPRSALAWAALGGHLDAVRLLLERLTPTEINAQSPGGATTAEGALHCAILAGHRDLVDWLLANLPRESIRDREEECLRNGDRFLSEGDPIGLRLAAAARDPKICARLIDYWIGRLGSRQALAEKLATTWHATPRTAISSSRHENMRLLWEVMGEQRSEVGAEWLVTAAGYGQRGVVKELLRLGARPSCTGGSKARQYSVLTAVIDSGMSDLIPILIRAGATPNCPSDTYPPLQAAVNRKDLTALRALVEGGATVGENGVLWGQILGEVSWPTLDENLGELMLSLPSNIDLGDPNGRTALMHATLAASPKWVKHILERGADPLRADLNGHDAIHFARINARTGESGVNQQPASRDAQDILDMLTK